MIGKTSDILLEMIFKHFPAFRYSDFRLLWTSDFISRTGTQLLTVAISWHLYLLTHSPFALGLVGVVQLIPLLLFNLIGGAFADAHNRKKILYITLPFLALTSFLLGFFTFIHIISPLIIYILIAIAAIVSSFYVPAYGSILPSIIEKKDLTVANSTFGMVEDLSEMIGPAFAGILIASVGVGNLYFLDALSTVIALLAIYFMHYSGEPTGERSKVNFAAVKEGYNFLMSKKVLWSSMLLDALSVLFASSITLMPVFANDILHVGPQGLGFLYAAPALGAIIVGLIMSRGVRIHRQGKILLLVVSIYAVSTIIFGFSKFFPLSIIALIILGGANVVSVTIRSVIRQTFTPDNMMGRLYSFFSFVWISGDKLGDIEGGFAAQLIGAPAAVIIGGLGALGVVFSMALFNPELRNHKLGR